MPNHITVKEATLTTFSGILAISPEEYKLRVEYIAKLCNRTVDTTLLNEISEILKSIPSYID